jgi:hypothetical protein
LEDDAFWFDQHRHATPDVVLGFDLLEYSDLLVSFLIPRAADVENLKEF